MEMSTEKMHLRRSQVNSDDDLLRFTLVVAPQQLCFIGAVRGVETAILRASDQIPKPSR
jgi:hypothetical protein